MALDFAQWQTATLHTLRVAWRRLYRTEPPAALTRDLLLRGVTYKLQEKQLGGLDPASARILRKLTSSVGAEKSASVALDPVLTPGARIARHWRGITYTVLVLSDGFEHDGQRHRSLSEIARKITGTNWSGPRFFGLFKPKRTKGEPNAAE